MYKTARQMLGPTDISEEARKKSEAYFNSNYEWIAEQYQERLQRVASNPNIYDYDMMAGLAAKFISDGKALPKWLATFATDVLRGKIHRDKCPRPKRSEVENAKRWSAVLAVSETFGLPRYLSKEAYERATTVTAARVVAEVSGRSVMAVIKAFQRVEKTNSEANSEAKKRPYKKKKKPLGGQMKENFGA